MKALCASGQAQGVTDRDEELAEKIIRENLEEIRRDAVIVRSLTDNPSSVFDNSMVNTGMYLFLNHMER